MRQNSCYQSIRRSVCLALVVAGWVAIALTGAGQDAWAAVQAPALAGNAENGRQLWVTYYCYSCHGWSGHGGAGPSLAPNSFTPESFVRYIRKPAGNMPPYTSWVMSDQQIADVHAFLATIPASPNPESLRLLDALLD